MRINGYDTLAHFSFTTPIPTLFQAILKTATCASPSYKDICFAPWGYSLKPPFSRLSPDLQDKHSESRGFSVFGRVYPKSRRGFKGKMTSANRENQGFLVYEP